jgi:hypothetical protein
VRELGPGSAAQFSPRGVRIAIYAVLTVKSPKIIFVNPACASRLATHVVEQDGR